MGAVRGNVLKRVGYCVQTFYRRHGLWKSLFGALTLFFLSAVAAVALFVTLVWSGFFGKLPATEQLREIHHPIASEVYSADSVLLGRYYVQDRTPVAAADVPENLKHALVATEDVRFYEHSGIDFKSLLRVLIKTVFLQHEASGGGSTITQQLAKNLFPRTHYALLSLPINKVREMLIARRLESLYTKDEILVLYLNTIPFADNTYGVKSAADRFFSTLVKDLTTPEAAMLVGMLKATHNYNPRLFPERAIARRNLVIAQMAKYGFISAEAKEQFQAAPLALNYNNVTQQGGIAAYFRAYLRNELLAWCREHRKADGSPYNLYTDGLKIYTTLDSRLQAYAEGAMEEQMKALQEKFSAQLNKRTLDMIAMQKMHQLPQYKALKQSGMPGDEIIRTLKKPAKTRIYTWDGIKEVEMSLYDSLRHHMQFLQAGMLAMEPGTGNIRVWVGGIDHRFFQYDHVRPETKRQVGSTLKPILYAAALEEGISPCSYISARKTEYTNVEDWTPENTDEETYVRKYSMEGGLAGSVNTVSVKLLEKTGIGDAIAVARRMGITSELPAVPSLALGTASISVMEMVGAYGALANEGVYTAPRHLVAIADRHGVILERADAREAGERAISPKSAAMMLQMLKSVVSQGTGSALRARYGIQNDIAGKTGTTQHNVDGWFMAITPKLVIGTWVGADDPRLHFNSTRIGQGAATALPMTAFFLKKVNADKNLRDIANARFAPLSAELKEELDCKTYKSDLNLFERIFKTRKKTKAKEFRGVQKK